MSTTLPTKIQAARKAAGLTQEQLAKEIGVTRGAVTQWESRNPETRSNPGMDHLRKLSDVTKLPFAWLMDDRYVPHDAPHVRNLNMQGRWQEVPVKMEGGVPSSVNFTRATVIEPIAALLHNDNTNESFAIGADVTGQLNAHRRHPRLAQLFWNSVQYQISMDHPEWEQYFEYPLDGARADYFDGKHMIEFTSWPQTMSVMLFKRRLGDMLLNERLWGNEVRKYILAWGSTPEKPEDFEDVREFCRRVGATLEYFTDPKEAVAYIQHLPKP